MILRRIKIVAVLLCIFLQFTLCAQNRKIAKGRDTSARTQIDSNLSNAQNILKIIGGQTPVPVISYEPVAPPRYWTKGMLTQLGFSQVSLTNWAAGGTGSVAMNAYVNINNNYAKDHIFWDNRLQLSFGFIQSFDRGYRKSDDKIILDSKLGYSAFKHFYLSAAFNYRSQFTPGFEYPNDTTSKMVSQFMSPGYFSLGLGLDYKPDSKIITVTFSPLTLNTVVVTTKSLRTKYGNKIDEPLRWEVGAQLTGNLAYTYRDIKISSKLSFFSDYLNKPQNIQIYWDVNANYKVNKFLTASLRTSLIYDNNILIANKSGHLAPRVQFKEVLSLAFSYTFGEFKK